MTHGPAAPPPSPPRPADRRRRLDLVQAAGVDVVDEAVDRDRGVHQRVLAQAGDVRDDRGLRVVEGQPVDEAALDRQYTIRAIQIDTSLKNACLLFPTRVVCGGGA